jgi:general secretion pathway protein K
VRFMPRSRTIWAPNSRQRGIVLLLVLWVIILLTVLVASYVQSSSTEGLQARFTLNTTQARYAAEAGMHRAIYELNNPTLDMRWRGDGRPYEANFNGAKVIVEILDETGKIDINSADIKLLGAMFLRAGVPVLQAEKMGAAVIDFRDVDDVLTPGGAEKNEYSVADLNYGPRNQYFTTVSELQQVIGMTFELFERIEPMVTTTSGGAPNLAFAQSEVMAAVFAQRGTPLSQEQLDAIIQLRQTAPAGQPITLPDGTQVQTQGYGTTFTIKTKAELPNGAKASLEATVQLGSGTVGGRPFRISRWREGKSS